MPYSYFRVEKKSPIALILTRSTVFSTLSMFYKLYEFKSFTFSTVDGGKNDKRDICHSEGQAVRGTLKRWHNKQMSYKLLC